MLVVHSLGSLHSPAPRRDGKAVQLTAAGVAPGYWLAPGPGGGSSAEAAPAAGGENELILASASVVIACGSTPTTAGLIVTATW